MYRSQFLVYKSSKEFVMGVEVGGNVHVFEASTEVELKVPGGGQKIFRLIQKEDEDFKTCLARLREEAKKYNVDPNHPDLQDNAWGDVPEEKDEEDDPPV